MAKPKSKQKPKTAPEKPKSFEEAEAVPLTDKERAELSRKKILEWFRAQRYEKLKALRDEIREGTISDQESLKETIIKKTTKELEDLNKDIPLDERKEIAENFSKTFFDSAIMDDIDKLEEVLGGLSDEQLKQKMFFMYLDMHGSAVAVKKFQQLKQTKALQEIFQANPSLERKYDEVVETGDADKITDFLRELHPDFKQISKEKLYFTVALFAERESPVSNLLGKVPYLGEGLKAVVSWGKKAKEFANMPFFIKVAKKIDIKVLNLMNIASMTLSELRERHSIFQEYKPMLVSMRDHVESESKRKKIERKLKFIEDVNVVFKEVENVRENNTDFLKDNIRKTLEKEKHLNAEDINKIMIELDLDSVRVQSYLPAVLYGTTGEVANESNLYWMGMLSARGRRMAKAYKAIWGRFSYEKAMYNVMSHRLQKRHTRAFKKEISKYSDLKSLQPKIDDFKAKIKGYEVASGRDRETAAFAEDMAKHDDLLRQYYALQQKMSDIMSTEGNKLVEAGAQLDKLPRGTKTVSKKSLSANTIDILDLKNAPAEIDITDLQKRYTDKLVDFRKLRDVSQTEFAGISRNLRENVIEKFDNRYVRPMNYEDLQKTMLRETDEIKKYMRPGGRAWKWTKKLALPAFALGLPLVDVARGKSRWHDAKWDMFDAGIGFVPVLGTINDFKIAWNAKTTSGRKLNTRERLLSFGFGVMGLVSDAAWILGVVGGVMRAGVGSLRVAKGVARAGKLARSADMVRDAEKLSGIQKFARKIYRLGSGWSKAEKMQDAAKTVAVGRVHDYLSLQKKLGKAGKLDDLDAVKQGSKYFDDVQEYKRLLRMSDKGRDFEKLRQSMGIAEEPGKMSRWWTKRKIAKIEKSGKFTPKEVEKIKEASKTVGKYDDLIDERRKLEATVEAAKKGGNIEESIVKDSKRRIAEINDKLRAVTEIETKIFAKAERIAQTSRIATQASKYIGRVGFAGAAIYMLTGMNPVSEKIRDEGVRYTGVALSKGYKGVKWGGTKAMSVEYAPPPLEAVVQSYVEKRKGLDKFQKEYEKLENSNDPKKKKKIEALCVQNWDNPHVQAWARRHKDKLNIRDIIDKVRKNITLSRKKIMMAMQSRERGMPANMDLLTGKRGNAGLEMTG